MASNPSITGLSCPACNESGSLHLRLDDGMIVCHECDEEFDRARIEQVARNWVRLLEWLKRLPAAHDPLDEP